MTFDVLWKTVTVWLETWCRVSRFRLSTVSGETRTYRIFSPYTDTPLSLWMGGVGLSHRLSLLEAKGKCSPYSYLPLFTVCLIGPFFFFFWSPLIIPFVVSYDDIGGHKVNDLNVFSNDNWGFLSVILSVHFEKRAWGFSSLILTLNREGIYLVHRCSSIKFSEP